MCHQVQHKYQEILMYHVLLQGNQYVFSIHNNYQLWYVDVFP